MMRNLLANAMKYTEHGEVLLGCRRRAGMLRIEIWDTGIGIPEEEIEAIFEEYHQLDNPARERNRGLGLGLSIVQRLGNLLGHRIGSARRPGKGSGFYIESAPVGRDGKNVGATANTSRMMRASTRRAAGRFWSSRTIRMCANSSRSSSRKMAIATKTAEDGIAALDLVERGTMRPDLMLADYNLPNGMNGLEVAAKLREKPQRQIPVIVLTGDISTDALRQIARQTACNSASR